MFHNLPDSAKLWIYGFESPLDSEQQQIVKDHFNHFVSNWKSHGKPVKGDYTIAHDRFLLIAAIDDPSGCSIDSSVSVLKRLREEHGIDGLNQNLVFFKKNDGVHALDRYRFQQLVYENNINEDTIVYDTALRTVGELKNKGMAIPFKQSWHNKAFRKSA